MTQQIINVGELPNDGSGDPLRLAFQKINENFTSIFSVGAASGQDGQFQYRDLNDLHAVGYYNELWIAGGFTKLYTSINTVNWDDNTLYSLNQYIRCITETSTGLIAVGDNGLIITSPDGFNWTTRTPSVVRNNKSVAINPSSRYVIVGSSGSIQTSNNAITWATVSSGVVQNLNAIIFANSKWVTVGDNGTILYSTDSNTWLAVTPAPTAQHLYAITWDGLYYTAVGANGSILRSSNGISWSVISSAITATLTGITTANLSGTQTTVVVGYDGSVYRSVDYSATWTVPTTLPSIDYNLNAVKYSNLLYTAVGSNGTVLSSSDGLSWSDYSIPGVLVGSNNLRYNTTTNTLSIGTANSIIEATGTLNFGINSSNNAINIGYTNVSNNSIRTSTTLAGKLRLPVFSSMPNVSLSDGGDFLYNVNTGNLNWYDAISSKWREISSPQEKFTSSSAPSGTVTYDCVSSQMFFISSPTANWTANFINLGLLSGYSTTIKLAVSQGAIGYYPNVMQISGVTVTINWRSNTVPIPSSNRIDMITFNILNSSGTYTVLGQLLGY